MSVGHGVQECCVFMMQFTVRGIDPTPESITIVGTLLGFTISTKACCNLIMFGAAKTVCTVVDVLASMCLEQERTIENFVGGWRANAATTGISFDGRC